MKLAAINANIDGLVAYIMKRAYEHNQSERSDKKDDIVSNEFKAIILAAIQPGIEKLQRRVAELEGQVQTLREACEKSSAEVRHAFRFGSLSEHDAGLCSRAVKMLENAVTATTPKEDE